MPPYVVADLVVHVLPHRLRELVVPRQILAGPGKNFFLVLEEEEDQQRHQDQVDENGDKTHHRRPGQGEHGLAVLRHLGADGSDQILDLVLGDELGILHRQTEQSLLGGIDHDWHQIQKLFYLPRQHRDQAEHDDDEKRKKEKEYHHNGEQPWHPPFLQGPNQSLQKIGNDDAGDKRHQHVAENEDKQQKRQQNAGQEDDLGIREVTLEPVGNRVHQSASTIS